MVFPLYNALESLDRNQIEAARDLGAPWWRIHLGDRDAARQARHRLGRDLVFMLCAGALAAPLVLGGPKTLWFTPIVYDRFFQAFNWPQGAAYALVLLLACMAFVLVVMRAVQGQPVGDRAMISRASRSSRLLSAAVFRLPVRPAVVMGVTAFNTPEYPQVWPFEGFTLEWFGKLLPGRQPDVRAQQLPASSACFVVALSVPLGLAGALVMSRSTRARAACIISSSSRRC